jgi:hypothetical protein
MTCACGATRVKVPCGTEKNRALPSCVLMCKKRPYCHHPRQAKHKCHVGSCPRCKKQCLLICFVVIVAVVAFVGCCSFHEFLQSLETKYIKFYSACMNFVLVGTQTCDLPHASCGHKCPLPCHDPCPTDIAIESLQRAAASSQSAFPSLSPASDPAVVALVSGRPCQPCIVPLARACVGGHGTPFFGCCRRPCSALFSSFFLDV